MLQFSRVLWVSFLPKCVSSHHRCHLNALEAPPCLPVTLGTALCAPSVPPSVPPRHPPWHPLCPHRRCLPRPWHRRRHRRPCTGILASGHRSNPVRPNAARLPTLLIRTNSTVKRTDKRVSCRHHAGNCPEIPTACPRPTLYRRPHHPSTGTTPAPTRHLHVAPVDAPSTRGHPPTSPPTPPPSAPPTTPPYTLPFAPGGPAPSTPPSAAVRSTAATAATAAAAPPSPPKVHVHVPTASERTLRCPDDGLQERIRDIRFYGNDSPTWPTVYLPAIPLTTTLSTPPPPAAHHHHTAFLHHAADQPPPPTPNGLRGHDNTIAEYAARTAPIVPPA